MQKIQVMINGLPGKMAQCTARHLIADNRFHLIPLSFTGPEITLKTILLDQIEFSLIPPEAHQAELYRIKKQYGNLIIVDYSHPSAVNLNAELYCLCEVPFVMGTTGGDRKKLTGIVTNSSISAVIAPNMAKQIVALQAMFDFAANTFPGLFSDYSLKVKESHQKQKADTSGTAKAIIHSFNKMGIIFDETDIELERNPERQRKLWGIPEKSLDGHGWHTYTLVSADQTVKFEFTHNVNGRDIYAKGTLDAIMFLHHKISSDKNVGGTKGTVYSMIDVLQG